MSDDRKVYWPAHEILQICEEERLSGLMWERANQAVTSIQCGPEGITRQQVVDALRFAAAIPEDDGGER